MPEPAVPQQDLWRDLEPLLDEELSRLPDKYRVLVVLCDLEGKTRKEAARQLGCPEGTVAGRLARGRTMLAKRLARRGLAVSGGALAGVLSQEVASAGVPAAVASSAIKSASLFAAGQAAATGAISAKAAALTEGVLKAMLLTKLKPATAGLLLVVAALCSATGLIYRTQAAEQRGSPPLTAKDNKPSTAKRDGRPEPDKERLQGTWKIVSLVDDGEKHESEVGDKWTFKGTTVKEHSPAKKNSGESTSYLRYRLDETTSPRLIDLVEGKADDLFDTEAFDKRLGDVDERKEGIYAVAGDSLTICISRKKGERPTAFESRQGSDYLLIVLKRESPNDERKGGGKRTGFDGETKNDVASAKSDGSVQAAKPRRGPQEYKGIFKRMLAVIAEHFEQITYANQYDGRIEACTVDAERTGIIREADVRILSSDDGGLTILVTVNKVLKAGGKSKIIGRDAELERTIMQMDVQR
jgi:uncharacterized protein (TIGR03067 family)